MAATATMPKVKCTPATWKEEFRPDKNNQRKATSMLTERTNTSQILRDRFIGRTIVEDNFKVTRAHRISTIFAVS